MYIVIPNERENITILTVIATSGDTIPNYYVFKGARVRNKYIALFERGATMRMQKRKWMNEYLFSQ